MNDSIIDYPALYRVAGQRSDEYRHASPFPHIVLEKIVRPDFLQQALRQFPTPEQTDRWRGLHVRAHDSVVQTGKLGLRIEHEMPSVLRCLVWEMNSAPFIAFLERLTGVRHLLPDPSLQGGGLHQVLPGGVLGVHADFTHHRRYGLDRRLNVLLYLNPDWRDEYGGNLELWSQDMVRCERNVKPSFGRCVIFNTDSKSFHGHPRPLSCPKGMTRKSIALYYFTSGREDRHVAHTKATDWQKLPDADLPAST